MNYSQSKLKLLILLPGYFEENMGGAELQAKYLIQGAIKRNLQVFYVFLSENHQYINPLAIELHSIQKKKPITKLGNIKYPYFFSFQKMFSTINPDIIYNRTATALTGTAAYYAQNNNCRLIYHIASDLDVQPISTCWRRPYMIPEYKLMQYGIRKADSIIAQTEYQADELWGNYGRKAIVIPNGHPVSDDCQKSLPVLRILWIANFKLIKQPELFVRLAADVGKKNKVKFIMVGRTGGYDNLASEAGNIGIEVMGEIPNNQVNKLLEESDILINTSKQEGFSNTFIQAWMRRVPIISLQVDPDGVLKHEQIGFCSGNYGQMVEDTHKLIGNKVLRKMMGEKAREYAVTHHSLDNIEKILDVIQYHDNN